MPPEADRGRGSTAPGRGLLREETLNRKRAESKLQQAKARALKPQKAHTSASARELFEAATGRAPRPTSAADQRALEVAEVGARCRAKLEEDVARLRGDVEVLRAALESQPKPWSPSRSSTTSALRSKSRTSRRQTTPSSKQPYHRRRTTRALHWSKLTRRRPASASPARDDRTSGGTQQGPCGCFRTRQFTISGSRKRKGSSTVAADGQTIRGKLSEISTLEKKLSDVQGKARTHERALRRYAGTKELVRRDRLDYALDLKSLDAMLKNVAVDVVREVCRDLRLSDAGEAPVAVRKLCAATKKLPALVHLGPKKPVPCSTSHLLVVARCRWRRLSTRWKPPNSRKVINNTGGARRRDSRFAEEGGPRS